LRTRDKGQGTLLRSLSFEGQGTKDFKTLRQQDVKISRLVNFERSRSHARSEFTGELEARKKDDPSSRPFTNSKI
jgi:hypothetical protein